MWTDSKLSQEIEKVNHLLRSRVFFTSEKFTNIIIMLSFTYGY